MVVGVTSDPVCVVQQLSQHTIHYVVNHITHHGIMYTPRNFKTPEAYTHTPEYQTFVNDGQKHAHRYNLSKAEPTVTGISLRLSLLNHYGGPQLPKDLKKSSIKLYLLSLEGGTGTEDTAGKTSVSTDSDTDTASDDTVEKEGGQIDPFLNS